jgi:hypothetical protein
MWDGLNATSSSTASGTRGAWGSGGGAQRERDVVALIEDLPVRELRMFAMTSPMACGRVTLPIWSVNLAS